MTNHGTESMFHNNDYQLPQLTLLDDIHTTDLTEACMLKGHYRRTGRYIGEVTTALFRGLAAGATLEFMHNCDGWSVPIECVRHGLAKTEADLADEGRAMSDVVERDKDESITVELERMAVAYADRFAERFAECELIGTELPIRCEFESEVFPTPISFASHVDLMFRDVSNVFGRGANALHVWDWKWREKAPTLDYLARNQQFAAYYYGVEDGVVRLVNDTWVSFGEHPVISWVHLGYLMPFGRKTTTKDDDGQVVTFLKGECRPERVIVRTPNFKPDAKPVFLRHLTDRAAMIALGIFPPNPDPIGCSLCESREECDRYDDTYSQEIGDDEEQ